LRFIIKNETLKIFNTSEFSEGNKYWDFNPSMDKVAAVGIGGLVAGKVLAKAGLFVILLKYLKSILVAVLGGGSWLWSKITGKKEEEPSPFTESEVPIKEDNEM
jgi:uncharacterized membrane-anchored protein